MKISKQYKEYIGEDMYQLASRCKQLYEGIKNEYFEYDTMEWDMLLFTIKYLIEKLDI